MIIAFRGSVDRLWAIFCSTLWDTDSGLGFWVYDLWPRGLESGLVWGNLGVLWL